MAEGDVTISVTFTKAQWDRIIAASGYIKGGWSIAPSTSTIDAAFIAAYWKEGLSQMVKDYELSLKTTDDF